MKTTCLLAVALLVCSSPLTALAQTVLKTYGQLENLEAGDVACYATLLDEEGASFTEMADFGVCDQTELIGEWVTLTYEIGTVLAASCQGDMDCGKSDTVALIASLEGEMMVDDWPGEGPSKFVGSWEPLPGEAPRREVYTFNEDGTLVISDGLSNRMQSWTYDNEQLLIDGQPMAYDFSHVALILEGAAHTTFHFMEDPPQALDGEAGFDPHGYFTASESVRVAGTKFYGLSVDFTDTFDTGEGLVPAVMLDFETMDGAYLKVFPSAFRIHQNEVALVGHHDRLGTVQFFGTFDPAMAASLERGEPRGTAPLLKGHLFVNGHLFYDIPFQWASGE
ncbi:MAG: hypothetical protein RhofKO_26170 [Rhodothermales bacterium]